MLNLQTDPANFGNTAPLNVGSYYAVASDSWIIVNALGVDENGVDRADITAWSRASQCVD